MLAVVMVGQPVSAQNWGATSAPAQSGQIVMVEAGSLGSTVSVGGTVVAYKQVLLTAQLPGRIEFIAGKEGDKFSKDQVLVAIDDDDLLAKRRAALAQWNSAQAAISNAQMQYSRELYSPQSRSLSRTPGMGMPSMFDQMFTQPLMGMMPGNVGGDRYVDRQADLYTHGTQLSQAQSQLASARAQIDEIDAKLRDARSFAPFDGVIVRKLVEEGDTVNPGQAMLEFADLSYLQIEVDVPSRLMPGLSKGMIVPARLDVGDTQVSARVAQIFPTADAQRHTVTVKFDLPVGVPGGPGMYAEVMVPDVSVPVNSVPTIPDSAVIWRGSLPAVFVVGESGQPSLRLVRLGSYVGPSKVSVLSGLRVGEQIFAVPPDNSRSAWSDKPAN
jgi:multidrug efflux pump subunit AcrA (membrane-fusion protein)